MTQASDTPRTDAECAKIDSAFSDKVSTDFARQLERELAAANTVLELIYELAGAPKDAPIGDLPGYVRDAIAAAEKRAQVAQQDEARELLWKLLSHPSNDPQDAHWDAEHQWFLTPRQWIEREARVFLQREGAQKAAGQVPVSVSAGRAGSEEPWSSLCESMSDCGNRNPAIANACHAAPATERDAWEWEARYKEMRAAFIQCQSECATERGAADAARELEECAKDAEYAQASLLDHNIYCLEARLLPARIRAVLAAMKDAK